MLLPCRGCWVIGVISGHRSSQILFWSGTDAPEFVTDFFPGPLAAGLCRLRKTAHDESGLGQDAQEPWSQAVLQQGGQRYCAGAKGAEGQADSCLVDLASLRTKPWWPWPAFCGGLTPPWSIFISHLSFFLFFSFLLILCDFSSCSRSHMPQAPWPFGDLLDSIALLSSSRTQHHPHLHLAFTRTTSTGPKHRKPCCFDSTFFKEPQGVKSGVVCFFWLGHLPFTGKSFEESQILLMGHLPFRLLDYLLW